MRRLRFALAPSGEDQTHHGEADDVLAYLEDPNAETLATKKTVRDRGRRTDSETEESASKTAV
jgi:hypothetical protein